MSDYPNQLDRIEGKLDLILQALADEGDHEQDEGTTTVTTMDGVSHAVEKGDGFL